MSVIAANRQTLKPLRCDHPRLTMPFGKGDLWVNRRKLRLSAQTFAALGTTRVNHFSAAFGRHAGAKSVIAFSF